ncbi:carbohydrate ABC transporter membrane protein 1 (CUT1 family) [Paenibacillus cellulosilyticus]|uniref:Maltose/maltodextrin transport system permease protein n=1 Tax=Paenibacillus cellulosilyticus TaxID=375489 RepID=A0A2V2YVG4_9BACL|nr:sugar ABC transporter permease [Paenibacillus cellulosilyticus]PWW05089.1 carbohydrate ABC transporter membrane protein 1 (CUT1 family) [Paenibacillus cellulosilyticus]QKS48641.1 sugar ABC transporter permease [Paenibacillus cellulosilyticus]
MTALHTKQTPAWAAGLLSAIVWGAGQTLNRQYLKGLLFFLIGAGAFAIEIATGRYTDMAGGFRFRENGGFFLKGLWGLFTLGTQPRTMGLTGLTAGDHSIVLMANGIIALFILLLFLFFYIWNIRDAAKARSQLNETGMLHSSLQEIKKLWESMYAYIILSPAALLTLFICVLPIVFGVLIAFTDYSRSNLPPTKLVHWVGLNNFVTVTEVFSWMHTFLGVLLWTFVWAILATITTYFFGFFQAVLLNSSIVRFKKLWRSIYILPWAVPAMISALVFKSMFNGQFGPISQFLLDMGLTSERIYWFTDPSNTNLARILALLINLWLGFPYFMALIGGTLTTVSESYYEAARMDGANAGQMFWKITFPIVYKATAPLLMLSFVSNFNNFGVIYFLTEGGPANPDYNFAGNTDLLITWLYKLTLDNRLYNMGAVMSIIVFLIVASFSLINLRKSKSFEEL